MANAYPQPCDEAVILSQPALERCKESAEPWVLTATILGSSMAFIDGTIVNVALPALQSKLNATMLDVQWVVESYSLFLSALLLVGGSFGDRYGRRFIYAIGVTLFAIASIWCGLAPNIQQLILARAVQGIGGALLVPGSLAIISASFSEEKRGKAIGTWSGFTAITAAIGPVAGGWLIENISWRAAFFINVPIAAIVIFLVIRYVPESRNRNKHQTLDLWGAVLATSGLGALVYGLIESSRLGFGHWSVLSAIVAGIILLAGFVFFESRTSDPMLPLKLFESRNFMAANVLTLLLYAALGGALFFFPLNLIQIQGYSATAAGAGFLPFILIMFLFSRWSGGLVSRYGARKPLAIGPVIAGVGFALFSIPSSHANYWTGFFPAVITLGIGMAITVAPLTTTVMNSVDQNRAGIASGISNAVSRTAGLLAIAVFGILMLRTFSHHLEESTGSLPQETRILLQREKVKLAALTLPPNMERETQSKIRHAVEDSFVSAFRMVMLLAAALAGAGGVSAWLIMQPGGLRRDQTRID
jgi:EmrB/QacA subfamily drug resistance transporter